MIKLRATHNAQPLRSRNAQTTLYNVVRAPILFRALPALTTHIAMAVCGSYLSSAPLLCASFTDARYLPMPPMGDPLISGLPDGLFSPNAGPRASRLDFRYLPMPPLGIPLISGLADGLFSPNAAPHASRLTADSVSIYILGRPRRGISSVFGERQ